MLCHMADLSCAAIVVHFVQCCEASALVCTVCVHINVKDLGVWHACECVCEPHVCESMCLHGFVSECLSVCVSACLFL